MAKLKGKAKTFADLWIARNLGNEGREISEREYARYFLAMVGFRAAGKKRRDEMIRELSKAQAVKE